MYIKKQILYMGEYSYKYTVNNQNGSHDQNHQKHTKLL